MERRDLPLLLASDQFSRDQEAEPLDRVRIQKGVFLLEMRGPVSWRDLYTFIPYAWGPYSSQLTTDVGQLLQAELLTAETVPYRRYMTYRTTAAGQRRVDDVLSRVPAHYVDFIARVREFVTSRSFSQLLKDVYTAYPEYAVASRFQG